MDLTTGLIQAATNFSAAKTAYEANVMVMKKALETQAMGSQSLMSVLDGGDVNKAVEGAVKGATVDFIA